KDQFEDSDGCPEPDNDRDGILDVNDQCPNEPEDIDQFEDENGCPDPDNDQDGILDVNDRCPNEPETQNGFKDEDGCPDEAPKLVKVTTEKLEILEKVYFDTAKATLQPRSFPLLDDVARILESRPDIKTLTVEGHTDSQGNDASNLKLSQARAESVCDYLESKGIARERLVPQGYGESQPVDTNDTAAGRENNRRVEFKITSEVKGVKTAD
ncbi:MAG: OmpA family protein, partial [Myxococcota bacterium]